MEFEGPDGVIVSDHAGPGLVPERYNGVSGCRSVGRPDRRNLGQRARPARSYPAFRDLPIVQAIALIVATIYVGVNLSADLLTMIANPRLRTLHTRK